jgi:UDP-GlcNAc:undecaprenyl-phosphate GlcNAc-1-phosphate transferase
MACGRPCRSDALIASGPAGPIRDHLMQYRMLVACVAALLSSTTAMVFLYHYAEAMGLVDRPSARKQHIGNIPLIGGLSAFFGVLVSTCIDGQFQLFTSTLLGTAAALALTGALDDRFDLSVRIRLLVQASAVLMMIFCTGIYIHTLGHLFGYELELGVFGIPLTLIAVIGLLNAFNMMDGIDGLAGMLALVSIGAISLFQGLSHWHSIVILLLLAVALLPDLVANLGLAEHKIFLGDAGSMVVGYLLAWTLIYVSQGQHPSLSTVDVLWCVALPVLDTLAVMIRRLREGKSPFKPDRGHVHHLLLDAGFSPRAALVALVALAMALVFIGALAGRRLAPGSNLLAFGAIAVIYIALVNRIWKTQQARLAIVAALILNPLVRDAAMTVRLQAPLLGLIYAKNDNNFKRKARNIVDIGRGRPA